MSLQILSHFHGSLLSKAQELAKRGEIKEPLTKSKSRECLFQIKTMGKNEKKTWFISNTILPPTGKFYNTSSSPPNEVDNPTVSLHFTHWNTFKLDQTHWNTLKYIQTQWNKFKYIQTLWNTFKYIQTRWNTLKHCIEHIYLVPWHFELHLPHGLRHQSKSGSGKQILNIWCLLKNGKDVYFGFTLEAHESGFT